MAIPLIAALAVSLAMPCFAFPADAKSKPNIVFILCDDLGYGDVKCLNAEGKIATPRMDSVAADGMTFTDAHSGSAVCSPTRYGVVTGRYAWRSRLKNGVLGGLSPRLIEPERMTIASFLKSHGYHTACIGKWHLGMDWALKEGKKVAELSIESADQVHNVFYDKPTTNGPNSVGFDWYYGISASLDMVPYTFIENDHCAVMPSVDKAFAMMFGREGQRTRKGPAALDFDAADVLPRLTEKAVELIRRRAKSAKSGEAPFFLYLPLASPHTPILPTAAWQRKSGLNPYGDFVMETDAAIGRVIDALEENDLTNDTLIVVTSDNGCSPMAKFDELLAKGHNPSATFRGHKADIFEGGHRVPFLVKWPGRVKPGSQCSATIWLGDFFATCADILGESLPDAAGEDSVSLLPLLDGKAKSLPTRAGVVHHSINGSFAVRSGEWKLIFASDSGGWSAPRPGQDKAGKLPRLQLYNLTSDVSETRNVQDQHPEVVTRLTSLMEQYIADGRSTPGAPQTNTTPVDLWRGGTPAKRPGTGP